MPTAPPSALPPMLGAKGERAERDCFRGPERAAVVRGERAQVRGSNPVLLVHLWLPTSGVTPRLARLAFTTNWIADAAARSPRSSRDDSNRRRGVLTRAVG